MLQEDEKRRRSEQIRAMRSLPVYMKSTFSSQIQATVARDAGTANAQRRPMGVDPVRCGETMLALSRSLSQLVCSAAMPLVRCSTVHAHAQCRLIAGRWHCSWEWNLSGAAPRLQCGAAWCRLRAPACPVPLSGAACVRPAQSEMLARPISEGLYQTYFCNLRFMQPSASRCTWS